MYTAHNKGQKYIKLNAVDIIHIAVDIINADILLLTEKTITNCSGY